MLAYFANPLRIERSVARKNKTTKNKKKEKNEIFTVTYDQKKNHASNIITQRDCEGGDGRTD